MSAHGYSPDAARGRPERFCNWNGAIAHDASAIARPIQTKIRVNWGGLATIANGDRGRSPPAEGLIQINGFLRAAA